MDNLEVSYLWHIENINVVSIEYHHFCFLLSIRPIAELVAYTLLPSCQTDSKKSDVSKATNFKFMFRDRRCRTIGYFDGFENSIIIVIGNKYFKKVSSALLVIRFTQCVNFNLVISYAYFCLISNHTYVFYEMMKRSSRNR